MDFFIVQSGFRIRWHVLSTLKQYGAKLIILAKDASHKG